jgi:hypothetical protein
LCGRCSTFPPFDLLFEAAMGRRLIQLEKGLVQWISTPVRILLDFPTF